MLKIKNEKVFRAKCECCQDALEIYIGKGQVIIEMYIPTWGFWRRVKHSLGLIFKPEVYKDGGCMWMNPKRFKKFIKEIHDAK